MEFISTQKFIIMSPRKIRPVADMIKKMKPAEAIEKLPFVGRRVAVPLAKVIKTAIANAKNKGISESDLIFKEIQINQGPSLKRGQPVSRGQWHPIKRRMSHIRVVLTTLNNQISNSTAKRVIQSQINSKLENKKEIKEKGEKSGTKS